TQPPVPYNTKAYERVWAAAQANGLVVTFHVGTGFNTAEDSNPANFKAAVLDQMLNQGPQVAADQYSLRLLPHADASGAAQRVIVAVVGSGVLERYPDLHFVAVEFNAHWLASLMGSMDKACTLGIGQDPTWDAGVYDHSRAADDQPTMMLAFAM